MSPGALSVVLLVAVLAGCGGSSSDAPPPPSPGVGDACGSAAACRSGLACSTAKACVPSHASALGSPCILDDECTSGAVCGATRACTPTGAAGEGDACLGDGACRTGLRCVLLGLRAECRGEGSGDVGDVCATSAACLGGLACSGGRCAELPVGVSTFGWADGSRETCTVESGPVTAHFRVPRGTSADGDFYRLPFPNDIRRQNGKLDLGGHPTPGPGLLGFDWVDRLLRALEQSADGFGGYPTVLFRFSGPIDRNSFRGAGVITLVDVTAGAPEMDDERGLVWYAGTSRGAYICGDWLGVRPAEGHPLLPNHTYAVVISKDGTADDGTTIRVDDDFGAVLADAPPADATLSAAYAAYAPLRAHLDRKSVAAPTVLDAAAIAALGPPKTSGWARCGDGPDPCPDATGDRGCATADPAFDELHALVSLPVFQVGDAPYVTPDDGGGVDVSGASVSPVRTEAVCLSLSVPRTAGMPPAGWPLVVYAPDVGGSHRSNVLDGVASMMANAAPSPAAVLSIDPVEHGTRRGTSTASPESLLFTLENPAASRGNLLQGAADQISLGRLAATLSLDASASPTGAVILVDPAGISFFGHSLGATLGGTAVPYAAVYGGAALSAAGGSYLHRLLATELPTPTAALLPLSLEDADPKSPFDVAGRDFHPVLSLLQSYLDPVDPLHHAATMTDAPPAGQPGHHVLQAYGLGDGYCPHTSQATYAVASVLALVSPDPTVTMPDDLPDLTSVVGPVKGNKTSVDGKTMLTSAVREYQPEGYDGHLVVFQNPAARTDVSRFLSQLGAHQIPQVGP